MSEKDESAQWVLLHWNKGPDGQPLFLMCMTAIGAACTDKVYEAERFATERAAMLHPAYLGNFEPHNIRGAA